jgi:hypothetical protein
MNVTHVAQIALELNALPDEERDEIGRALERIVGFLDHIGLGQHETTIRELTMPLDIGGGRWERHLKFKALIKRCGVKKFRCGVADPNYRALPR